MVDDKLFVCVAAILCLAAPTCPGRRPLGRGIRTPVDPLFCRHILHLFFASQWPIFKAQWDCPRAHTGSHGLNIG